MANVFIHSLTDTWSNVSTQYTGIGMAIVDDGSTANSYILNFTVNSDRKFSVDKSGIISISGFTTGNSTVNSTSNSTFFSIANTTQYVNIGLTSISAPTSSFTLRFSNTTANLLANSTEVRVWANGSTAAWMNSTTFAAANASATSSLTINTLAITSTSSTIRLGNTTANLVANTTTLLSINATANTTIVPGSINVSSNTGLTVGTYVAPATGANGYISLPNGLRMNYGWVQANTSVGNATFAGAFTTACLSCVVTGLTDIANGAYVNASPNTTVAVIRTASATAANVSYIAIGF